MFPPRLLNLAIALLQNLGLGNVKNPLWIPDYPFMLTIIRSMYIKDNDNVQCRCKHDSAIGQHLLDNPD